MDYNKINLTKPNVWNRRIINAYWTICLIYFIGQITVLLLKEHYYPAEGIGSYIIKHIITPNLLLLCVMLFTEFHYRVIKKYKEEFMILSSILVADAILITISPRISGGQIVLLLPILISIFYFNKKLLCLAFLINFGTFTALYLLSPYQQEYISIFAYVVVVLMLVGGTVAGLGIINKGAELLKNIEELAKSEEKLIIEKTIIDKLSKTDALTSLYNHISFHEYADSVISQCEENGMTLQLALIDIDNFKKVNDTFGHRAGDTVLKRVSQIILENITPDDFAARYGGEEFALVFTGKKLNESFSIVERIRSAIETAIFFENAEEKVTISIGLHHYVKNEGKESLFNHADTSLYTAKKTGKNKTICTSLS